MVLFNRLTLENTRVKNTEALLSTFSMRNIARAFLNDILVNSNPLNISEFKLT